MLRKAHPDLAV
jgi:hypothetical protein